MNYTQLTEKKKVEIDILLEQALSMREVGRRLKISHSTISRYKNNKYTKRTIDIESRYKSFINYLNTNYDKKTKSIEVCVYEFKKKFGYNQVPSVKQVYNWINNDKIKITRNKICYKKRKRKNIIGGMIRHTIWSINNKTVLPISLRPKYIEKRAEIGHLEIDSIIGKRNEYDSIISIVDRCTRRVWLIKAEYKFPHYISNLIYKYIIENDIVTNSITIDNGLEFETMGITAKKLGVKLYKCDPYCSFQRGSNERMNAIVRRFIPKGESMKTKSQVYLEKICFEINSMPRKIFNFKSAFEVERDL